MPDLHLIPMAVVHPDKICTYSQVNWIPHKPVRIDQSSGNILRQYQYGHLLESKRSANGKVSEIARRKINRSIEYLLLQSQKRKGYSRITGKSVAFKIAFITLTLPSKQKHSDNKIKNICLNQFLIEISKKYKVTKYVWRAEKQKNGNIHFHVLINRYIPWEELRNVWNRIVEKLGYVTNYRKTMEKFHKNGFRLRENLQKHWTLSQQKKAYEKGIRTEWNSPNTSDIHALYQVKNVKKYITKYMQKEEELINQLEQKIEQQKLAIHSHAKKIQSRKRIRAGKKERYKLMRLKNKLMVSGRIWGCSQKLSNVKGCQIEIGNQEWDELTEVIEKSKCHSYSADYFSVFYINYRDVEKYGGRKLYQLFCQYIYDHFQYSIQSSIPAN